MKQQIAEITRQARLRLTHNFLFVSKQGQVSALKGAYIFKVFRAQTCLMLLMITQSFDQLTYVCEQCNNFQDSKLIFMSFGVIFGLTVSFTFIRKEKLHVSLIFSFYCYQVKENRALLLPSEDQLLINWLLIKKVHIFLAQLDFIIFQLFLL